jgi:YD repeat-containing protein
MVYDKLGRMTQRTEAEGTSTWTYDTKSKGIGKPAVVTGPNGNDIFGGGFLMS